MKKGIICLCFILIVLFAFCSCTPNLTLEEEYNLLFSDKLKVEWISALRMIDINNLNVMVGYSDCVFVGKVKGYLGTINDTSYGRMPQTKYSVEVVEKIKGNLVLNSDVELLKAGGLAKNRRSKILYTDDSVLPEIGNYYAFLVRFYENGEVWAYGANTHIEIENTENLHEDAEYKRVVDAYANEVEWIPNWAK